MADLFGDWVPDEWIQQIKDTVRSIHNRHHTFQFLTKNPKRLKDFNPWPRNAWVGTTVTNQADSDERIIEMLKVDASVRFVSHEPLLGKILLPADLQWAIIGAQTGPGAVKPEAEWVRNLIDQYRAGGVPLFLKDNLNWPEKIQEWPNGQ